ncbi:MAG: DNA methyltransferase [Chloroflexota bacterium]|nr:DNA adenine methylase [Chloroflexota bacterium]NOG65671.1 DNA adenine methylase [Chloroflexota bacterium]GIK63850.1 MAG: DNA methyltransferase [Chloroflexota bacterium]
MGRPKKHDSPAAKQAAYRQRKKQKRNTQNVTKTKITNPALRYHGGKFRMAPWIIKHFPEHTCYVEPFCGAASVLLRKPPSAYEVINDLNSDVVNFFDVLRDRTGELARAIELTPFSREMQLRAYEKAEDNLERVLRLYIRVWQSYGPSEGVYNTGWRYQIDNSRGGSKIVDEWSRLDNLYAVAARLKNVMIEHDDALNVIPRFDSSTTLFYVDPPYPHETRGRWSGIAYVGEMSNDDHRKLAEVLRGVKGMVALSGYECDLYQELYPDWKRLEKSVTTNGNGQAVESLWLSPRCTAIEELPLWKVRV